VQSQQLGFPPAQLNIRSSAEIAASMTAPDSAAPRLNAKRKLSIPGSLRAGYEGDAFILEASRPPIRGEKGAHGHADHVFDTII
jgi:hypothetical protein